MLRLCLEVLCAILLASCGSSPPVAAIDLRPPPDASRPDLARPDRPGAEADRARVEAGFPAPTPDDCIKETAAGDHVYDCEGLRFDVTVPAQCLLGPCGLVADVHGLTMSGKMQDNNTGMRALGKQHGYLIVQPNAKPNPPLASWSVADDAKIHAFLLRAIAVWHLDPKRVHFTGFSQGGSMTWRFIAKYLDLLASAAPAAAACDAVEGAGVFAPGKKPDRPFPLLYLHGTKDVLANPACANKVESAVVAAWGLTQTSVVSEDAAHKRTRHTNSQGALFERVSHDYAASAIVLGGHCYPGSGDLGGGEPGQLFGFACLGPNAFTWGEVAIQFFIAHPKP